MTADAVGLVADPNERLKQLQAAYVEAKAANDAASEHLRLITDAIKAELQAAVPGTDKVVLPAAGDAPALTLTRVESWRIDTARLKREQLATYVQYAKKSESWTLRAVSSNE